MPSSSSATRVRSRIRLEFYLPERSERLRYQVGEHSYYAVRGKVEEREWLVIFDAQGVLETAFPPNDIDDHLNRQGFEYVGTVGEILL